MGYGLINIVDLNESYQRQFISFEKYLSLKRCQKFH